MNKFWEVIINSRGKDRFYCFPFLILFRLITPIYHFFSRRNLNRRKNSCSKDWQARVISIGNVTVGGSGKTPIIIWLAERFLCQGKRVVIVHSGYGRQNKEDVLISPGAKGPVSADSVGDEVTQMLNRLPLAGFAVGRDKKAMVVRADKDLHPDVILIDDGFQRLDIKKDVDVAVVSPSLLMNPNAKEYRRTIRLFPSGVLREPVSALSRAEAVFAIDTKDIDFDAIRARLEAIGFKQNVSGWKISFKGVSLKGNMISRDETRKLRPYLFAGIGSFERLRSMILSSDITVTGMHNFGDHYTYDKSDFEHLRSLRQETKADCYLTTAKDLVKLPEDELDAPLYCLELDISPFSESGIDELLLGQ